MLLDAEEIKEQIADGSIRAITLDTSIFDQMGLALEYGVLARLKQFVGTPVQFVLQEVVAREVKAHLTGAAEKALGELGRAMKAVGRIWEIAADKQDEHIKSIVIDESPSELAERRFAKFAAETGLIEITSADVDVSKLVSDYFDRRPPFGVNAPKEEFPDAIALAAIELWAAGPGATRVLAVSKDGDWKRYCEQSERLILVEDLADALSFFHASADVMAMKLARRLTNGEIEWHDAVAAAIDNVSYNLNLVPEAPAAAYFYESDISQIDVLNVELEKSKHGVFDLRAIDQGDDYLVVQARATVRIDVEANFQFFINDSIDHDQVPIGDATASERTDVDADVVLTFFHPEDAKEIGEIEIEMPKRSYWLEFDVEGPDYGDGDK